VLETVQEHGTIGAPPPGSEAQRFVVSHRSEEALGQSLGKTVLWLGVGGIASIVVGSCCSPSASSCSSVKEPIEILSGTRVRACVMLSLVLQVLEDAGRPHPAADAHRDHAVAGAASPHLAYELDC
jgi:hypothetical protein